MGFPIFLAKTERKNMPNINMVEFKTHISEKYEKTRDMRDSKCKLVLPLEKRADRVHRQLLSFI